MSEVILQVDGLRLRRNAESINLSIRSAEMVGLAGLDGHGQEDFLRTLYGLRLPVAGRVIVETTQGATLIQNAPTAVQAGVVYLPRNRKTQGILPTMTVLDNFSIAAMNRPGLWERWGIVNLKA